MIKAIILNTGYVESQKVGTVWFVHNKGFKTSEEAIKSLAKDLKNTWRHRPGKFRFNGCAFCILHKQLSGVRFCSNCGTSLLQREYDYEGLSDAIYNLPGETCDSWPFEVQNSEWWPWCTFEELISLEKEEIYHINEQAEEVLKKAILKED